MSYEWIFQWFRRIKLLIILFHLVGQNFEFLCTNHAPCHGLHQAASNIQSSLCSNIDGNTSIENKSIKSVLLVLLPSNFFVSSEQLLNVHPGPRLSSQRELQQTPLFRNIDFNKILQKQTKPPFKPPEDHLNCDPSLELEEMIVEAKPLHKKKKRLAKQRSAQKDTSETSNESIFIKEFIVYNRYKELKKRAMERKENEWQQELDTLMANSQVCNLKVIEEATNEAAEITTQTSTTSHSRVCGRVGISATTAWSLAKPSTSNCAGPSAGTSSATTPTAPKDGEKIDFIDRTPSPDSP